MRSDVTIANKYGRIDENLFPEFIAEVKRAGKSPDRIPRGEYEKYIILKNQDRPIFFTERRDMTDLGGFLLVPEGLVFRIIREADSPKYQQKVSEEYWKRYRFRNFGDARAARDFSADMIIINYHYMRAQSYFQEGKTNQAIEELEKLKKPAESYGGISNNVGNMLAERGFLKEALSFYEKALYYDPDFLLATQNMAKAYLRMQDYKNCLKYLNRALQIKPNDFDTRIVFAQMYLGQKDFDNAIMELENLTIQFPHHFLPYRILGYIHLKDKKDANKAFQLFQKSLELNPNQPDLNSLLQQMKK
jgi:tetratricopeptide (TPR) repeat protein